jgi:hypothetical protein
VGFNEFLRIAVLHQAEAYEQPPEQQDFRSQEQPHTKLAGIELLLHRGEVVLMVRVVLVFPVPAVRLNVSCRRAHAIALI